MHLFSRNSIILYSLLGLVSLFLAGFIKDVLEFNTWIEVIITSSIIIPMYMLARKIFGRYLDKE
jgi:MFS-type transporter involved in bile tolerance (Atg22 family)